MAGAGRRGRRGGVAVPAGTGAHAISDRRRPRLSLRPLGRPPRGQGSVAHLRDDTGVLGNGRRARGGARGVGAAAATAAHRGHRETAGIFRLVADTGAAVDTADAEPARIHARSRQHQEGAGRSLATGGRGRSGPIGLGHELRPRDRRVARERGADPAGDVFLLREWDVMIAHISDLIPRRHAPLVKRLARDCDTVLSGFLRGQLSVMLALGSVYTVGLYLVGLDLALLIGVFAGLVSFVPYLGFIMGIVFATIAVLMQYHDVFHLLLVFLVFGIGQTLESFVFTPWLVGDRIGLHPVTVIFAVMAGGLLFGCVGVLLALPVAAVVGVLVRYAHERYLASGLYAGDREP